MTKDEFAVAILAAGASSRFGKCKLVAQLNGNPVIQHSLNKAVKVFDRCNVILGCHENSIRPHIAGAKIHVNKNWQAGLSSSITLACTELNTHSGLLILLADQYKLSASFLRELKVIIQNNPSKIIATQYQQQPHTAFGPPVYFPKFYFEELSQQAGENGAKLLLKKYREQVLWLINAEAALDIDYPEDLDKAAQHLS